MIRIDPDTFEEWTAHPITEALYAVCSAGIKQAEEAWISASLKGGVSDPLFLREIRARITVFDEIRNLSARAIEDNLNEQI